MRSKKVKKMYRVDTVNHQIANEDEIVKEKNRKMFYNDVHQWFVS